MTDKQIIIDGVDVHWCEHYTGNIGYLTDKNWTCRAKIQGTKCEDWSNCYFKRWQRKEQECEELRGDLYFTNEQLKDFKSHYDKVVGECENLREKYLGLKEQKGSYIVQLNTVNEQLDQLKEQIKYQNNFIESLLKATNNSEWLDKSILDDEASEIIEKIELDYVQLDEFKQTLTEIKEIAEKSCCLQPTSTCEEYENCKECSRTSDDETVQQILQKISEVEND